MALQTKTKPAIVRIGRQVKLDANNKSQEESKKRYEKKRIIHKTSKKNLPEKKANELKIALKNKIPKVVKTLPLHIKSVFKSIAKGPKYHFNAEIPNLYNETYMCAIPRDPHWLYVYWEISGKKLNEIRISVGDYLFTKAKRVLRLLDISDNGEITKNHIDIEIDEFVNNKYIKVPQSGRTYIIEYGILFEDGRLFLPVRSNVLSIPRERVSQILDEEWSSVTSPELIHLSSHPVFGETTGSSQHRIKIQEKHFSLGLNSGSGIGF